MRFHPCQSDPGRWPRSREAAKIALAAVTAVGLTYVSAGDLIASATARARGCAIKGNISAQTGERIYSVPGQDYYEVVRISPEYGERWFCSESEAQAAGWRKATR
ncbi:sunset domain-containing protein [Rhizobium sp. GN54]|uniref:sunset domain-containing protein n=1 Tax=Rhizobium sp. GN54 TaxID=2898150 RepID=UPI001E3F5E3C|nr:succinoglycan biosynthesis protein exoi [Rhizobium sp. GN54]MCD2181468.1 succinoglycan biosynthesis protein exoi [Rhizobium sp. GN54]